MLSSYLIELKEKQPLEVFYKNAVLKNFVIMGKHLRDIFQSNYFEKHYVRLLLSRLYEVIAWNFFSGLHVKPL